jgi:4-hydroxythreonine-4-phosphate dehydrogenase
MKTTIGITAGDPAGIGLEVVLKAIPSLLEAAHWVLFVDQATFLPQLEQFQPSLPWSQNRDTVADNSAGLWIHDLGSTGGSAEWGRGNRETGQRALRALDTAGRAALDGHLDAIVTAPLSKQHVGGGFRGQTEFLAEQAGVDTFAMSFFSPTFKVVLATTHLPLSEAIRSLSSDSYVDLIRFVDAEFRRLDYPAPRIAVAGINPHAGEGGLFGSEDEEILRPAVRECCEAGIAVSGPHPADSLYFRAHSGDFDVVVAPYHDQGLIPIKLISNGTATNVTLGLPYVRTSPDHGTAFDIAGQGVATPEGMKTALVRAIDLVRRTQSFRSP